MLLGLTRSGYDALTFPLARHEREKALTCKGSACNSVSYYARNPAFNSAVDAFRRLNQ